MFSRYVNQGNHPAGVMTSAYLPGVGAAPLTAFGAAAVGGTPIYGTKTFLILTYNKSNFKLSQRYFYLFTDLFIMVRFSNMSRKEYFSDIERNSLLRLS